MIGLKKEDAGKDSKVPRATARGWAVSLLSQLMPKVPEANEFRVRFITYPKSKRIDVEVTVVSGRDSGAD
jgi:hypothetical protein